jgi:hypothetical protein
VDPGGIRTADAGTPLSWNRYTYVQGDPVNHTDRHGLFLDAVQCINDPNACLAEDDCYGDGLSGGLDLFGQPDPGCPSGDSPDPPSAPKPTCNPIDQNWINLHGTDAVTLVGILGDADEGLMAEADVLALSALESGWGKFTGGVSGAWFGMHGPLPGQTTCVPTQTPGQCVSSFPSFLAAGTAFANSKAGQAVRGVTNPTTFFTTLNSKPYSFGWTSTSPVGSYVSTGTD